MGLFGGSKVKKLAENKKLDDLIPFLYDKSAETVQEAREAFLKLAQSFSFALISPKAMQEIEKFAKSPDSRSSVKAWQILLKNNDLKWMPDMVRFLESGNDPVMTEIAMRYFDDVRAKDPDRVRNSLSGSEKIHEMIEKDLSGEITLENFNVQRAYRFVELFNYWDRGEIADKTLYVLQSQQPRPQDRALHTMLMDAMVRMRPEAMAKMLIADWEKNFATAGVSEQMVERFKDIGKKALPLLKQYVVDWRNNIESSQRKATTRDEKYEVSRWAIFLIGELAYMNDQDIMDWLFEVSIDTKLAETGAHRKNAKEALEKIRVREVVQSA
ncbi:MAG: hypothetical protein GX444_08105 [Myxococcales bacterium]|nr:hypothetical protein [Myxococcales bacterium]